MTAQNPSKHQPSHRRRATWLAGLLSVQAMATVFFVADVISDLAVAGPDRHSVLEAAVAVTLVTGVVFGGIEMRRTLERSRRAETALSVASGAFAELITGYFDTWELTPAESDVALFALKGFDAAEIAEMRGSAAGTVRAQLARVYSKAGVSSRTQFVSLFIDDLLTGPLTAGGGPADPVSGQSLPEPPPKSPPPPREPAHR